MINFGISLKLAKSYPMRMALVEVIGYLIREMAMSADMDQKQSEKQLKGLYELLLERTMDNSSYVLSGRSTSVRKTSL